MEARREEENEKSREERSVRGSLKPLVLLLERPGGCSVILLWDNYKGSPMLELWTARTRNLGEP